MGRSEDPAAGKFLEVRVAVAKPGAPMLISAPNPTWGGVKSFASFLQSEEPRD